MIRLARWLLELLISLDQFFHVLFGGPKYLIIGGPCPSADETISSKVGRASVAGKRWAVIPEAVINWMFVMVGAGPDHCRRMIGR